jgi:hypothetical protein
MIKSYCKDLINILRNSYDEYGGVTNTGTQSNVKCHIEDYNELIKNQNGQEVFAKTVIFIPVGEVTGIEYTDRIQLVSRNGEAYENANKEFSILSKTKPHGFSNKFYEVYL